MRPVLKAGLRRLWRPGGALQVGVTPGRSLLLNGLGPAATAFVAALDGRRDIAGLLTLAEELGLPGAQATTLLDMLARAGFLDDAAYDPGPALRALDVAEADRLAPDMAALALGYLVPGGAVRAMTRRRMAVVAVYGCGRVGASVAHMLAVGRGRVRGTDRQRTGPGGGRGAGRVPESSRAESSGRAGGPGAAAGATRADGDGAAPPSGAGGERYRTTNVSNVAEPEPDRKAASPLPRRAAKTSSGP